MTCPPIAKSNEIHSTEPWVPSNFPLLPQVHRDSCGALPRPEADFGHPGPDPVIFHLDLSGLPLTALLLAIHPLLILYLFKRQTESHHSQGTESSNSFSLQ